MMRQATAVLAVVLFSLGCTEREPLTGPDHGADRPTVQADVRKVDTMPPDEGEYTTEAEFASWGVTPSATATVPIGTFTRSTFDATSRVDFKWVTFAEATLTASLNNRQGTEINKGIDYHRSAVYRPVSSGGKDMRVSLSTMNHTCGLLGKSAIKVDAETHLIRLELGSWKPFRFWEDGFNRGGADVTQPSCEREEKKLIWESGEGCGDGEYCQPDKDGQPSQPGGGGGGSGGYCTLWEYTVYESADGGWTWEEVDRYYVWTC